ncbi:hypothetical protein [Kocuria rosea]|jgi:hypothetical protein|uniref:hypothetical protein n=2 Tax=Kocuria TaxID=57493 RepID=UPI00203ABEAB|nr:hypothetical protein [Kocuria rosea]MCM3687395.1 hypothetical protein [Kocuria rosea]HST73504.1 hypothetical protein [Kocuria rosea]
MSEPTPDPAPDPEAQPEHPVPVPGRFLKKSKLSAHRPHVHRLRAVRTGERAAAVYIGWPENTGPVPTGSALYAQALAVAEATHREDHLLETVPLQVTVHVHAPEPPAPGGAMEVLLDLSGLPTVQMEMHFYDLAPTTETLDWFLDAMVSASWALVETSEE